jgi:hypothetical protein
MERIQARFVGVELYFDNLERAKRFYVETIGLEVSDERVGHHARFNSGAGFVCLERRGLSCTPRKTRLFSSLRYLIWSQRLQPSGPIGWFSPNLHGLCCTIPKVTTYYFFRNRTECPGKQFTFNHFASSLFCSSLHTNAQPAGRALRSQCLPNLSFAPAPAASSGELSSRLDPAHQSPICHRAGSRPPAPPSRLAACRPKHIPVLRPGGLLPPRSRP